MRFSEDSDKVLSLQDAVQRCARCQAAGRIVAFTNGCFDLLHAGHVRFLQAARQKGDLLVVGLNTDHSVRNLKGPRRPILPERLRAETLAGLACVDAVILFDAPDPLHLIETLKPQVLVKGADWGESEIVGAAQVKAYGGSIVRVARFYGLSTSDIIARIVARFGNRDGCSS